MCWWKSLLLRTRLLIFSLCVKGFAKAQSIFPRGQCDKENEKKKSVFSTQISSDERSRTYLLIDRRPEVHPPVLENNKKVSLPPIHWDSKHAKKIKVKAMKLPDKTLKFIAPPQAPHQSSLVTAAIDLPMAASSMEIPAGVPAPSALWAGLGMLGAMGAWKWFARRAVGMQ